MTEKDFRELKDEQSDERKTFSQLYERPIEPQDDDPIVRERIAEYISKNYNHDRFLLSSYFGIELGAKPLTWTNKAYTGMYWNEFVSGLKLAQFLSLITKVYNFDFERQFSDLQVAIKEKRKIDTRAKNWLHFCRRVFAEENLGYEINDFAAVRYSVDQQFETGRQASIAALADSRFSSAKQHVESAYESFLSVPSKPRRAVREMFEGLESVFKTLLTVRSLTARNVTSKLVPVFEDKVATNETERSSGKKMMRGFAEWIDAAHFYRHAQKQSKGSEPSREYCIHILDSGSSYLRWLISIDRALNPSADVGSDKA